MANNLIRSLTQPFLVEGSQVSIGASIGISTRRAGMTGDADLLKQADSAMYAAKRAGKNRAVHFSPDLGLLARERLTLESELRGAVARLRELGISVAMDDFGTGYSSLSYLPELPFSTLKIDRTFMQNLGASAEAATMMRAMIELGKKMGLRVVVEGIETQ